MSQIEQQSRANARLLMLGLDSISLPFIRENLDKLPAFASLLAHGAARPLESTGTYMSASVWPTFATGRSPGEHGQYFPFQWSASERRYRRLYDRRWSDEFDSEPFWYRIARAGLPTIVFDISDLIHDERAPCVQISNWSHQSSGAARTSDPEALRDIQRRFGRRPIGPEVPVPKTARQSAAIRDSLIKSARAKADATLHLMQRPWKLFVTGWSEAHRAGHNLWPVEGDFASDVAPGAMLDVYVEIDRQVARVLATVEKQYPNTSVLLFAVHGMEANSVQNHFLQEILARLNRRYLGREAEPSARPSALNLMAFLRAALPPGLQYWTASMLGERVQDWVVNRAATAGQEWDETPSFALLSGGDGFIRLSIKDREPDGFFDPGGAELRDYLDWLKQRLLAIKVAGTDEPLIKEIVDVDAQFPGPHRHRLPDLILLWGPKAPAHRVTSPDIGEIEVSLATGRGGNHNGSAFLIARGDDAFLRLADGIDVISQFRDIAERYLLGGQVGERAVATG